MRKKFTSVSAVVLCFLLIFSLCGCSSSGDEEETEFQAATIPVSDGIPVSEAEIIEFFNYMVSYVQQTDNFTSDNKPGVNTTESLSADNVKVLTLNTETGETAEDESLDALNSSVNAIRDRIISGIDTSVPVVAFGDMGSSISEVIYPYDSAESTLMVSDVSSAQCYVDGSNMNITICLTDSADTVEKIFGTRDKASLIDEINSYSGEYAEITDYSVSYIEDEENSVYSTIYLSVEVEQQDDGTYKSTGRITALSYSIIADVTANALCKGSFEDLGNIQIQFRFTDTRSYEFDWLGSSTWEPTSE
ncbi:MAG: hypothetical protein LUH40_03660 [Clostridiales bacterium]|nr:hypothetical protein [Clostridiales bacterium]